MEQNWKTFKDFVAKIKELLVVLKKPLSINS